MDDDFFTWCTYLFGTCPWEYIYGSRGTPFTFEKPQRYLSSVKINRPKYLWAKNGSLVAVFFLEFTYIGAIFVWVFWHSALITFKFFVRWGLHSYPFRYVMGHHWKSHYHLTLLLKDAAITPVMLLRAERLWYLLPHFSKSKRKLHWKVDID